MTRDDIIKMAKEAGFEINSLGWTYTQGFLSEHLERFAALVATAVAEPVQEPVAWANSFDLQNFDMKVRTGPDLHHTVPLYTAPPKREWVGLTDEEKEKLVEAFYGTDIQRLEAVEAKLKEKNT